MTQKPELTPGPRLKHYCVILYIIVVYTWYIVLPPRFHCQAMLALLIVAPDLAQKTWKKKMKNKNLFLAKNIL